MISVAEAFRGLLRYPLRTVLSLLGLVIGVASAVGTMALLGASHRLALESITRFGALDLVRVESPNGVWRDGRWNSIAKRARLGPADVARLRAAFPDARDSMLAGNLGLPIRHGAVSVDTRIEAVGPSAARFYPIDMTAGRFFSPEEADSAARVAVLSDSLAADLFGRAAGALTEEVLVGTQRFVVVGVFDAPRDEEGQEQRVSYLPYRAAIERLGLPPEDTSILLMAGGAGRLAAAEAAVNGLLPHLRPGLDASSYRVESLREDAEDIEAQARMQATILGGVAALSMLVAASGILNTLLVGVRERTKEIGTRRALGARRGSILRQFLGEAVALAIPGAALGLALGVLLAHQLGAIFAAGLQDPASFQVTVGSRELLLAGVAAILVATLAGIAPAWRAANVAPAEALRYE